MAHIEQWAGDVFWDQSSGEWSADNNDVDTDGMPFRGEFRIENDDGQFDDLDKDDSHAAVFEIVGRHEARFVRFEN